jgi:hypothetical protein
LRSTKCSVELTLVRIIRTRGKISRVRAKRQGLSFIALDRIFSVSYGRDDGLCGFKAVNPLPLSSPAAAVEDEGAGPDHLSFYNVVIF